MTKFIELLNINIPFLSHTPTPASVTSPGVTQIERFTKKKKSKKIMINKRDR